MRALLYSRTTHLQLLYDTDCDRLHRCVPQAITGLLLSSRCDFDAKCEKLSKNQWSRALGPGPLVPGPGPRPNRYSLQGSPKGPGPWARA